MTEGTEPSLWDELVNDFLERDQERQDAQAKHNTPPGFYDAFSYPYQNEESFGLAEYQQELAEIRRLRAEKENNNDDE